MGRHDLVGRATAATRADPPGFADTAYRPKNKIRFITATSLFDGHDATINIMRRLLQETGVEVIHLGHSRSVEEIVTAAMQEDVNGIAVTSYQGGHIEFFKYMIDLLRQAGADDIKVFGGGGGVIVPAEIAELHAYGVARLYSPEDGQIMGLQGMINDVVSHADFDLAARLPADPMAFTAGDRRASRPHHHGLRERRPVRPRSRRPSPSAATRRVPVLGITGTGGSGKSSLTDELIRRFRLDYQDDLAIAVLAVDPSRRRSGGALLGRPHPHECDRSSQHLHALARDPRRRHGTVRRHSRRGRRLQGGGLRSHHRRDLGHRPGRRGDRRRSPTSAST